MTKEELLNILGHFTWGFSSEFFVETGVGNFIWSDPEYNGDNSFTPFEGSYKRWLRTINIPFGRDKGLHVIKKYCGSNIILKSKTIYKIDKIRGGFFRVRKDWENEN
jgi:hypothetical protein